MRAALPLTILLLVPAAAKAQTAATYDRGLFASLFPPTGGTNGAVRVGTPLARLRGAPNAAADRTPGIAPASGLPNPHIVPRFEDLRRVTPPSR